MSFKYFWATMAICALFLISCDRDDTDVTTVDPGQENPMEIECEMTARIYQLPNGEWSVSVENGTEPYAYLWSTGDVSSQILVLDSGDYSVEITDAEGCVVTQEVAIEISDTNPCQDLDFRIEDDLSGNLRVIASGGTPPYAYQWFGPNGQVIGEMESLAVTEIGDYVLALIDSDGCVIEKRFEVTMVNSDPCASLDPYIENTADFELTIITTGGTQPYTYLWSNGATTQVIGNLVPGEYFATVTDAIGCVVETRGVVTDPNGDPCSDFVLDVYYDDVAKTLSARVTGGTAPYVYNWSTGEAGERIVVTSGIYEVSVIDSEGCIVSMGIEVP